MTSVKVYNNAGVTRVVNIAQGLTGPPGASSVTAQVVGETPGGAVNGVNATFTTAFAFVPESVAVFMNGMMQKKIDEFNTSGSNTILLTFSPATGETILVNYLRA